MDLNLYYKQENVYYTRHYERQLLFVIKTIFDKPPQHIISATAHCLPCYKYIFVTINGYLPFD